MSLKSFHIAFITASTLLSLVLCLWGFHEYQNAPALWNLVIGGSGLVGLVLLIPYFLWFQKKMRTISGALLALIGGGFFSRSALACAVCFTGDPNAPMNKGIRAGVILLILVVGGVLGAIASIGVTWARRAKTLEAQ